MAPPRGPGSTLLLLWLPTRGPSSALLISPTGRENSREDGTTLMEALHPVHNQNATCLGVAAAALLALPIDLESTSGGSTASQPGRSTAARQHVSSGHHLSVTVLRRSLSRLFLRVPLAHLHVTMAALVFTLTLLFATESL